MKNLTAFSLAFLSSLALAPGSVVINEVDSDQTSNDNAEFIELYDGGAGNTALDGLVVVLFNGINDSSYDAIDLDGHSTDADGFFVIGSDSVPNVDLVAFATNGIQNGADAVAVYTGNDTDFPNGTAPTATNLVDALVYDTNNSDDPELLAILTPGQAQINEDGNGNKDTESISRVPDGGTALDTSTYITQPPTPGATNGTPTPEISVEGNAIEIVDGATTPSGDNNTDFGSVAENGQSRELTYTINNSGIADLSISAIATSGAHSADFMVGGISLPATIAPAGSTTFTVTFDPSALGIRTATVEIANNDADENPYEFAVQGTGIDVNTSIRINEVDADQNSTDSAEFIELYDGGTGNTSLDGLVLVLFNGSSDLSYDAIDLDGQTTGADGFFVIGSNNVPNVDLPSFAINDIQNGADAVALYVGNDTDFPGGTAATASNLIDAVVYDTSEADDAELLAILTPGQSQINENGNGSSETDSIARVPNGGLPRDSSTYVAQTPTPGATNILPNTYFAWIAMFPAVGSATGFSEDADGDGHSNGLEHCLGTDPTVPDPDSPVAGLALSSGDLSFQSTRAKTIASDVTCLFEWSTDLATWHADGASDGERTVTFSAPVVIDSSDPALDLVEVTAAIAGTAPDRLFVRIGATR